jgi:hypothetical protein
MGGQNRSNSLSQGGPQKHKWRGPGKGAPFVLRKFFNPRNRKVAD